MLGETKGKVITLRKNQNLTRASPDPIRFPFRSQKRVGGGNGEKEIGEEPRALRGERERSCDKQVRLGGRLSGCGQGGRGKETARDQRGGTKTRGAIYHPGNKKATIRGPLKEKIYSN